MLAMEEVLCELSDHEKRNEQGLPPGFRFHPTDEELIAFYLASKVFNGTFTNVKFAEVDLNRCEPWELPASGCVEADVAKMGEREWYLFSLRDRKYPTGLRTNRATGAGYWKATGKDKEVYSASSGTLLGMKKTLVFYKGRAPRGEKTKWVMHEYRLDAHFSHTTKEEWVICRIFHKSGEKKTPLVQLQGHSSNASTKPPLLSSLTNFTLELECQSQSPVMIHQDQDHFFPLHAPLNNSSFSDLFLRAKEPKLIKTEDSNATLYQHQSLDDPNNSLRWVNKLNQSQGHFLNPFPLEVDAAGLMAFSGGSNPQVRDTSTSTVFDRVGLQQVLDAAHIGIDSWPIPQHV
ncbi:hypothetical protein Fmac_000151 [Flemingia macrophylla]|uniref:NAC domain-containing protein n=1 Tax=Flemingia macrophylla TaxID=520843 RepID=A0ABD1NDG1_9FABA